MPPYAFIRPFEKIGLKDIPLVGGKNASLGEITAKLTGIGINVPKGFALTADAYWHFLDENDLRAPIAAILKTLDKNNRNLAATGLAIRNLILKGKMPKAVEDAVKEGLKTLSPHGDISVAVRSSATAEDLPEASFAGQQESFLNVSGEKAVINACRKCFASLFTDRAITYRAIHGFEHMQVGLSVGIQMMIRADLASAGVMFSIDTETGFPDVVLINAAWGLGEGVVSGSVDPDEYMVFKPLLGDPNLTPIIKISIGAKARKVVYKKSPTGGTKLVPTPQSERRTTVLCDDDILTLARWGAMLEEHYDRPMDMEWAKDGVDGTLYMLQARPETIQKRRLAGAIKRYHIKTDQKPLVTGHSIGQAVASGKVCRLDDLKDAQSFPDGAVLVTQKTDPDWVPVMSRASALITDHGGRTSHAAIVSRELNLPAIVGTGNASKVLKNGQHITVSCAEGDEGFVYDGDIPFQAKDMPLTKRCETRTKVMLNMANPSAALGWWQLPADGIGLARMEFIINNHIKVHPLALVHFDELKDNKAKQTIARLTEGFADKRDYFVHTLATDIAMLAASQHPRPVIVRLSDFKTNEYANLVGGAAFEPHEDNPMIGWRGASRYYDEGYKQGFQLECRAIHRVRQVMGFSNVIVMVPFCRTLTEADQVLAEMENNGLKRGKDGLKIYVMAEIPSNIILAEDFAQRFDGFSIGSNDLTQLTLGVDRDSDRLSHLFDARDGAVTRLIRDLITRAHKSETPVGLCGQAPSDDPDYARLLVEMGIDSLSVTPDSFLAVKQAVIKAEKK